MATSRFIDSQLCLISERHNGIIPGQLVRGIPISPHALENRRNSGLLVAVQRDVLAFSSTRVTPERRALAATLVLPKAAPLRWISHSTALAIHGATLRDRSVLQAHVSSTEAIRVRGIVAHRAKTAPGRRDLQQFGGGPVSAPWLAIVEAASELSEDALAVALDSLVQLGKTSLKRVNECAALRRWNSPGIAVLHRLLNDRINGAGIVRSFFEQDLDRLLRKAGFPSPKRNYRLGLPDGRTRTIDAAWPELRFGLEAESWKHHSNTTDWGRSRTRDRELTAHGWTIFAVVVEDVRKPASLLRDLAAHRAQINR